MIHCEDIGHVKLAPAINDNILALMSCDNNAPTLFISMGAEVARYLTSGLAYVQDKVRPGTGREGALGYAAGAGMRGSGLCQICTASL